MHPWHEIWRFTPQALLPFAGLVCTVTLGMFVWRHDRRSLVCRAFVALNCAAALWNLDVVILYSVQDGGLASAVDRMFQVPIISIPFLALFFILVFLGRPPSHPLLLAFGAWTAFLWWLASGDLFITGWQRHWFGFYGTAGPLYFLFPLTHLAYLVLSCLYLWRDLRPERDTLRRAQIMYLLCANVVFGVISIDNFGPLYGIDRLPLGNLAAVLYFCIIAVTIARHRLLDIRVLFRYGLLYSSLTFLLSGLYLLLVLAMQGWAQKEAGGRPMILSMLPALAVAFAFVPLKNSLQSSLDRRFFRATALMRSRLAEFPRLMVSAVTEEEVWKTAWRQGWSIVGPEGAEVLAEREGGLCPALPRGERPRDTGGRASLRIPVEGSRGRLGWCLLGRKRRGGSYGVEEVAFLRGIAGQAALALERVQLMVESRRRERMAALGQAAAFISHEMRGPLNVIRGSMALLRTRVTDGRCTELIGVVDDEVRRGNRVIDDFLSAIREPRPALRPLDLKALLEGLSLPVEGPTVLLDLPPGEMWVQGDLFQLRRLFENLLRNSAEACGQGGSVTVRAAARAEGVVTVVITDDGPGIDREVLPRLFEPFVTTKRNGTGLGLTIARAIAEAHGGGIAAESAGNAGAVFRIFLTASAAGEVRGSVPKTDVILRR